MSEPWTVRQLQDAFLQLPNPAVAGSDVFFEVHRPVDSWASDTPINEQGETIERDTLTFVKIERVGPDGSRWKEWALPISQ